MSFLCRHFTLSDLITVARRQHDRAMKVIPFNPFDLAVEIFYPIEGLTACDTINYHKALSFSNPLSPQNTIFFCTSRINDIERTKLAINDGFFPVNILNGRIVSLNKMA
jgi:hypothetical protein